MTDQSPAAEPDSNPNAIKPILLSEPSILPDIPAPARRTSGNEHLPLGTIFPAPNAIVTENTPLTISTSGAIFTPRSSPSSTPAPATATPAASHGLSPAKLTAAIVVPIALLAIIIPVVMFTCLSHRLKKEEQKHGRQAACERSSRKREFMAEKKQAYSAPTRPPRPEAQRISTKRSTQPPSTGSQPTRQSLGLFNFEFSPHSSPPQSAGEFASPNFRFSIARALKMRRSEAVIIQTHSRTPIASVGPAPRPNKEFQPPMTRDSHHDMASSSYPGPRYTSPPISNAQAQTSLFAPLERIGTQRVANRHSHIPGQLNTLDPRQHNRASSEILHDHNKYGRVRVRSGSSRSSRSSSGISPMSAHEYGPFSPGITERLSPMSFGYSGYYDNGSGQLHRASVVSTVADGDGSSTINPNEIV